MAEMIGFSASIYSLLCLVVDASTQVAKIVNHYQNAPSEIRKILSELSTIQCALAQITSLVSDEDPESPQVQAVQSLFAETLKSCTLSCKRLAELVDGKEWKSSVISRAKWVSIQRQVKKILDCLQQYKASFNLLLALLTSNYNVAVIERLRRLESEIVTKVHLEEMLQQQAITSQASVELLLRKEFASNQVVIKTGCTQSRLNIGVEAQVTGLTITDNSEKEPSSQSSYLVIESHTYTTEKLYHFPVPQYKWGLNRQAQRFKWKPSSTPQLLMGRFILKVSSTDTNSELRPRIKGYALEVTYLFPLWIFLRFALVWSLFIEFDTRKRQLSIRRSLAFPAIVDIGSDVMRYARAGDTESLKRLFMSGNARPTDTDITGVTPLHWAARRVVKQGDSLDAIKLLLHEGADINAVAGIERDTPLHWVSTYAASHTSRQVIKFLKGRGADSSLPDAVGFSPDDIFECLYGEKGQLNHGNSLDITPLMRESGKGDECVIAQVEELISTEAVLCRDRGGWTALHWAAMGGSILVLEKLIKAGTKAGFIYDQTSRHGASPKDVAVRYGNLNAWKNALIACDVQLSSEEESYVDSITINIDS